MKFGYIRDARQDENRIYEQSKILLPYNLDKIIIERTGDDLDTLLQSLQPGDELHVVKLDRLSRSVDKLQSIINMLDSKNIKLYEKGLLMNSIIRSLLPAYMENFKDLETT